MVEIVVTDEFLAWYDGLDEGQDEDVTVLVDLLAERGVALGFPYTSDIKGSRYPLRELRIQSGGHPLRVFYAFDPSRQAVLLIGGDKTGNDRFYREFIPVAEGLWETYLKEIES